jgi:signal transduction histidine kinase
MDKALVEKQLENFQLKEMSRVKELLLAETMKEIEKSREKVMALEKLRDDLTGLIVHDLKNPLTGMVTANELLSAGLLGPLTDEQKKYIDLSKISSKKLLNLIMDLLDTRKMEENKLTLNKTEFPAAELLKGLAWLEILAKQEKKTITLQADENIKIMADQNLITRVLENLATNAVKHTPPGGTVSIRVTRDPRLANILFEAIDTGEGIPKEYLGRLFERFFKVESQTMKTKIDTGLGLYFCKMAVEAHGGKIGVESTVGQGSKFFFSLPAKAV